MRPLFGLINYIYCFGNLKDCNVLVLVLGIQKLYHNFMICIWEILLTFSCTLTVYSYMYTSPYEFGVKEVFYHHSNPPFLKIIKYSV